MASVLPFRTAQLLNLEPLIARFRQRSLLQKVIGNTLWQLTDKIVRMIVSLLVGIWIARYLGPGDFGSLNFAIAFVALFTPLADIGLQSVVVRELVRRPEDRFSIVASSLTLRIVGAILAITAAQLCILVLRPDDTSVQHLVLAIALSLFPQSWDIIDFDYQSRMDARPIVVIRTISLLVFAAIKVALILSQSSLLWFAIVVAAEAALSSFSMRFLFNSRYPQFRLAAASRLEMRRLLSDSWPMALAGLSVVLYMRIDQVMIGQLVGDHQAGIFSAAVRVSESWYFLPMALCSAVAPALTSAHGSSEEQYNRKLVALIRVLLLPSVVIAVLLTFWSDAVVTFLYGGSYEGAGRVLAIHTWSGVFVAFGLAASPWFVNEGLLKLKMIYTMGGAVANVALNLVLIPRFGVVGAAVATLVSYSIAAVWLNAASRRTLPIFRLQLKALGSGLR